MRFGQWLLALLVVLYASMLSCGGHLPQREPGPSPTELSILKGEAPDVWQAIDAGAADDAISEPATPIPDDPVNDSQQEQVPEEGSVTPDLTSEPLADAPLADVAAPEPGGTEPGGPETEPLPVCPCFAKEGWCGQGVAKEAAKRGCRVPLLPARKDDLLVCSGGIWSVKQNCSEGCFAAPAGTADYCKGSPCGCLLGDGPYCGARASALAKAAQCSIKVLAGNQKDLLKCENDKWSVLDTCAGTCGYNASSTKLNDECKLPDCPCFVKVAWCGAGAAKEAASRGCKIPILPKHNNDILYCPGGNWGVKQSCPDGCIQAPTGTPDSCKSNASYLLPFSCGSNFRCSSGNHTSNHSGKDAYAYDFAMPVGTTVRAMRAGRVLRVRNVARAGSSCYNGGGSACANYANTVEVIHSDNTVALYMHLSQGTASVGQSVKQGAILGKSGNSGWSTGPHLHVQVQGNCGIWWCQSLPFRFGEKSTIASGNYVTSKNCP